MAAKAGRYIHLDTEKTTALEVGDPREHWVLCIPGEEVSDEDMEKYGLTVEDGKIVLPADDSERRTPPAKTSKAPKATKPKGEGKKEADDEPADDSERRKELEGMPLESLLALAESRNIETTEGAEHPDVVELILANERGAE